MRGGRKCPHAYGNIALFIHTFVKVIYMKAVKRSIILCALSLVLFVALLVGSTFAWFSDSITNSGNTITAGNLTAQWSYRTLNDDTAAYEPVSEELALFSSDTVWQPGEPHGYDFKVENTGSVDFEWELTIDLADTAGESQNNLTDVLVVYVDGEITTPEFDADGVAVLIDGTLAATDGETTAGADETSCEFSLAFAIPEDAGNDYQNLSVSFSLVLTANQVNGGWEDSQTVEVGA